MTFREKWQSEHVTINDMRCQLTVATKCPFHFGYEEEWDCVSSSVRCVECWNREYIENFEFTEGAEDNGKKDSSG